MSQFGGGGYPIPGPGGTPSQVWGGGSPSQVWGGYSVPGPGGYPVPGLGGYPIQTWSRGVPHPDLVKGGTQGTPPSRPGMGYPLSLPVAPVTQKSCHVWRLSFEVWESHASVRLHLVHKWAGPPPPPRPGMGYPPPPPPD